jgi:hypothetical protein
MFRSKRKKGKKTDEGNGEGTEAATSSTSDESSAVSPIKLQVWRFSQDQSRVIDYASTPDRPITSLDYC